jgi:hypothetical protein
MTDRTDPIEVFRARCEARALLYREGAFDMGEAVDALQLAAEQQRLVAAIGQDAVQRIISEAFAAVLTLEHVPDALPNVAPPPGVASATLEAAAWLWFQVGDEDRFNRFLDGRSDQERASIMKHIDNIEAKLNAKNGQ